LSRNWTTSSNLKRAARQVTRMTTKMTSARPSKQPHMRSESGDSYSNEPKNAEPFDTTASVGLIKPAEASQGFLSCGLWSGKQIQRGLKIFSKRRKKQTELSEDPKKDSRSASPTSQLTENSTQDQPTFAREPLPISVSVALDKTSLPSSPPLEITKASALSLHYYGQNGSRVTTVKSAPPSSAHSKVTRPSLLKSAKVATHNTPGMLESIPESSDSAHQKTQSGFHRHRRTATIISIDDLNENSTLSQRSEPSTLSQNPITATSSAFRMSQDTLATNKLPLGSYEQVLSALAKHTQSPKKYPLPTFRQEELDLLFNPGRTKYYFSPALKQTPVSTSESFKQDRDTHFKERLDLKCEEIKLARLAKKVWSQSSEHEEYRNNSSYPVPKSWPTRLGDTHQYWQGYDFKSFSGLEAEQPQTPEKPIPQKKPLSPAQLKWIQRKHPNLSPAEIDAWDWKFKFP